MRRMSFGRLSIAKIERKSQIESRSFKLEEAGILPAVIRRKLGQVATGDLFPWLIPG